MKIAVDTNILIRLITADDPKQLKLVEKLIREYDGHGQIFISLLVVQEVYWVLEHFYNWKKEDILNAIEDILRAKQFFIEHELAVKMAVSKSRKNEEFSDALIGQVGALKNLKTYTFDRGVKDDVAFVILGE